jgi:hypothetical protein
MVKISSGNNSCDLNSSLKSTWLTWQPIAINDVIVYYQILIKFISNTIYTNLYIK